MYRILVADDEPAGLNHVCMILKKKCPDYEIAGTAENGQRALEMIRAERPDVLITDIRMPVMDGIELVEKVKEEFPDVFSVIVSGYSEFEYAKSALRSGVCDYLLKPLAPSDMQKLMDTLKGKLNAFYYRKRNELLSCLCNGGEKDRKEIQKYFAGGSYYAALFRRNGRAKMAVGTGLEIFSMEEERVYIYGRDELEGMYLVPESLLPGEKFRDLAESIFQKEQEKGGYVTGIIYGEKFNLEQLGKAAKYLYRKLDEAVIIGKSRLLDAGSVQVQQNDNPEERKKLEYIEEMIRSGKCTRLPVQLEGLFELWKDGTYSQLYVESAVKYIFRMLYNQYPHEMDLGELEFMLDDAFRYAGDMAELQENVAAAARQFIPEFTVEQISDKESLFRRIGYYLNQNMSSAVSLGNICKEFGVSQTTLNRMFRTYGQTSFSSYLMNLRIEKAKQIMKEEPDSYIRDVAARVGYGDQFYFSRIFRSITGMCPKDYIEKIHPAPFTTK